MAAMAHHDPRRLQDLERREADDKPMPRTLKEFMYGRRS